MYRPEPTWTTLDAVSFNAIRLASVGHRKFVLLAWPTVDHEDGAVAVGFPVRKS